MTAVTIYRAATGQILRTIESDDPEFLALNMAGDEAAFWGAPDPDSHFILGGEAIPFPPTPGDWAVWDWAAQGWTDPRDEAWHAARLAELWDETRAERDRRLLTSDRYALPDYPHTEAERAAWLAYRQALRDLPEATSDPERPDWPIPPVI